MTLARAAAISILAIVLLAAGGAWTDASAWKSGPSTPSAPPVSDGDSIVQLDASTGVLGQGDGSVDTQSLSRTEASAGNEAGPAVVASSTRRVSTDAYLETSGAVGFGDSIFGYTSVASSSRRFTPDGYAETAGVAGATSSDLVGSIFGYTSVLKFNNGGLYSAAYTMTGPPPVGPAQVPLPSALALLASALGVVVGVRALTRFRVEASA